MLCKYYLKSISLSTLFAKSEHEADNDLFKDAQLWECDSRREPVSMRFLTTKDGTGHLYVVSHGTTDPADKDMIVPSPTLDMLKYHITHDNDSISIHKKESSSVMQSRLRQKNPVIVEIKGDIYVLSHFHYPRKDMDDLEEAETALFQVYHPDTNQWEALQPPD